MGNILQIAAVVALAIHPITAFGDITGSFLRAANSKSNSNNIVATIPTASRASKSTLTKVLKDHGRVVEANEVSRTEALGGRYLNTISTVTFDDGTKILIEFEIMKDRSGKEELRNVRIEK